MYFLVKGSEYYTSEKVYDPVGDNLVTEFTHTGYNIYKTRNMLNEQIYNIDFNMYQVPVDPKNVGKWDYIAIDKTSYNYNKKFFF